MPIKFVINPKRVILYQNNPKNKMSRKQKTSEMWNFFTPIEGESFLAVCNISKKKYSIVQVCPTKLIFRITWRKIECSYYNKLLLWLRYKMYHQFSDIYRTSFIKPHFVGHWSLKIYRWSALIPHYISFYINMNLFYFERTRHQSYFNLKHILDTVRR